MSASQIIGELEQELDDGMRNWAATNIETTKHRLDGYTDGIAFALSLIRGTSTLKELQASEARRGRDSAL